MAHKTLIALTVLASAAAAQAFERTDVQFWAGSGANQAVLVIDWRDAKTPQSLAWGFAWDGEATRVEMLKAIAGTTYMGPAEAPSTDTFTGADSRLALRLSDWGWGITIYAAWYDMDHDGGAYTIGWEAPFGTLPGSPEDTETGWADDADDHYQEGWATRGFWSYATRNSLVSGQEDWGYYSGLPAGLTNGEWVSLTFDATFSYSLVPGEPTAAEVPEPITLVLFAPAAAMVLARRRRRLQMGQ